MRLSQLYGMIIKQLLNIHSKYWKCYHITNVEKYQDLHVCLRRSLRRSDVFPLPGTEEIAIENSQRCVTVLRNLHGEMRSK